MPIISFFLDWLLLQVRPVLYLIRVAKGDTLAFKCIQIFKTRNVYISLYPQSLTKRFICVRKATKNFKTFWLLYWFCLLSLCVDLFSCSKCLFINIPISNYSQMSYKYTREWWERERNKCVIPRRKLRWGGVSQNRSIHGKSLAAAVVSSEWHVFSLIASFLTGCR